MNEQTNTAVECARCDGTGWEPKNDGSGVVPCVCRTSTREARGIKTAHIPDKYACARFDNFDVGLAGKENRNALYAARRACETYAEEYPIGKGKAGLLLHGANGNGKTHMAVATLKAIIGKGAMGLFVDYQQLLQTIRASYDQAAQGCEYQIIAPVVETEVVLIDDLGANRITDWVEDTITHIVNARYTAGLRTIATTNLSPQVMEGAPGARVTYASFEERLGPRVASRLHEMCRLVAVGGRDVRKGATP